MISPGAFCITADSGIHDVTRINYDFLAVGGSKTPDRRFDAGQGHDRLAGRRILSCRIDTTGLRLELSMLKDETGSTYMDVPRSRVQCTYTLVGP